MDWISNKISNRIINSLAGTYTILFQYRESLVCE